MKKLKITSIIAMLLITVLVLAGCGKTAKEQTAYELIKSATEKTAALDSSEMDLNMNMKMSFLGMTLEIPMNYNIKQANENGDLIALAEMDISVMGESLKADMFIDKDFIYLKESESGSKVKISVADDLAKSFNVTEMKDNMIQSLPEEILKDVEIVKSENGDKTVNVMIDEDKFNEIFREYADSSLSNVLSELSEEPDMDVKFTNTNVSITVDKNGYISKYEISFDLSMDMNMQGLSTSITATCESVCSFVDPGSKVTVERPSDLDEYIDSTGI